MGRARRPAPAIAPRPSSTDQAHLTDVGIGSREVGKYYAGYARFEIRAKVPHAQGLWPAF